MANTIKLKKLVDKFDCTPGYEKGFPPIEIDIIADNVTKVILCESEETKTHLIEIHTGDEDPVKLYFGIDEEAESNALECYDEIMRRL